MRNLPEAAFRAAAVCLAIACAPAALASDWSYLDGAGYYEPAYSSRYHRNYSSYYDPYYGYYSYGSYGYSGSDYDPYPRAYYGDGYGYYGYGSGSYGYRRAYYGYGDGYYGYAVGYASQPYFYSTYGNGYDTPCSRLVKVYDDAGGWVWGRRYYC